MFKVSHDRLNRLASLQSPSKRKGIRAAAAVIAAMACNAQPATAESVTAPHEVIAPTAQKAAAEILRIIKVGRAPQNNLGTSEFWQNSKDKSEGTYHDTINPLVALVPNEDGTPLERTFALDRTAAGQLRVSPLPIVSTTAANQFSPVNYNTEKAFQFGVIHLGLGTLSDRTVTAVYANGLSITEVPVGRTLNHATPPDQKRTPVR